MQRESRLSIFNLKNEESALFTMSSFDSFPLKFSILEHPVATDVVFFNGFSVTHLSNVVVVMIHHPSLVRNAIQGVV